MGTTLKARTVCVAMDGNQVVQEFSNVVTARNYQALAAQAGFGVTLRKVVNGAITEKEVG